LKPVATESLEYYLENPRSHNHSDTAPPEILLPKIMGCLANGLRYIHDSEVRHKDIKPSNIVLDGTRVLYTDFGIAHAFQGASVTAGSYQKFSRRASFSSQDQKRLLTELSSMLLQNALPMRREQEVVIFSP
jgi:serine/threonine protein kinase